MEIVKKRRLYVMQENPLKLISIRLSNWHLRRAKKLGEGNLSEGVRLALENMDKVKDK